MTGLRRFLSHGCADPFKGSVHATACGLSGLMCAYNVAAWLTRREQHLATNALLYGLATLYEIRQTRSHFSSQEREVPVPIRSHWPASGSSRAA